MSVDRGKLNEFASGSKCRTALWLSARIDGRLVYRWAHMGFNFIHFFCSPRYYTHYERKHQTTNGLSVLAHLHMSVNKSRIRTACAICAICEKSGNSARARVVLAPLTLYSLRLAEQSEIICACWWLCFFRSYLSCFDHYMLTLTIANAQFIVR